MGKAVAKIDLDALKKLLRNKGQSFLKLPNVRSVGIGYKKSQGKATSRLCIQFSVDKKITGPAAIRKLGSRQIPKILIDDEGRRIPTDILERSYRVSYTEIAGKVIDPVPGNGKATETRRKAQNPVFPGISIGNSKGTAGTLGAIVYGNDGTPYVLSNWHVLQGSDGRIGDDVSQPGPYDDSDVDENRIGKLVKSHLGIAGDCALASIEGREFDPAFFELGYCPTKIAVVDLGDPVMKSGRTSGITYGRVTRTDVTVKVDYGGSAGKALVHGFEIGPDENKPSANGELTMGGDSGSIWLIDNPADPGIAVGLHFASESEGSPASEHAVACYIDKVLEKLEVGFFPPK